MSVMTVFVLVAAALAVLSFARGIESMAHGGEADQLHSHGLMFQRVAWQALAVLLLMLAVAGSL
jgi:Hypoxia induced protein conserved region